jgi:hypothetical protein
MAEDITLDEKFRGLDVALNKLQRTIEAGGVVPDEMFDEFLEAAQAYRADPEYRALLGSAGADITATTSGSSVRS